VEANPIEAELLILVVRVSHRKNILVTGAAGRLVSERVLDKHGA